MSVTFAEEKWAEREAAFAQQLEQLRALVAGQGDGGPTAEAASTAAGDAGTIEDFEDDDQWNQVTRDKRRAVLHKQKEELASKVRAKLKAVAIARSPFVKK